MATTANFRNGMVLEIDGNLWTITYFQHVKPGKGGAFVRTKLKNVLSGAVVDRTFRAGERVTSVRLERRPVNYSYSDGEFYHFMDQETWDMVPVSADMLGNQLKYLKENMECEGLVHNGNVISAELPAGDDVGVPQEHPADASARADGPEPAAACATGVVVHVESIVDGGGGGMGERGAVKHRARRSR